MYKPLFNKREVLVFHQWGHKGYSLFSCLGREVVISVLSVVMLQATKANSISDETWRVDTAKTTQEVRLGDVGVTGSRAPLTQSQAARMVTVLTHDDIQCAPVQSINDLLKQAVGVDVRQRGALGSQTDISIRGGTQEQIIILLNGINICDPQTGHNTMDIPVDVSEILRIEVLEGPAGRAYGTSSLLGAINIVTKPAMQSSVDIGAECGSFGLIKANGRVNIKNRLWNNQFSGSVIRSDGFSRSKDGHLNTDYCGGKAFYQGEYKDESVSVNWHAGITDKGWGSSTFYASAAWQADEQYEHTTKYYTAIQAETKQGNIHFHPSLYWNQYRDRYEGYRGEPDKMKYNYNRCDIYGAILNCYFDWSLGRTAFGAELRNEDLVSGNLGEPLFQTHHISGTDRDYTLGINRSNISAHLEHNLLLKNLTLSAGFVAVKSSWSSMNMNLYPGIDISFRLDERWKLFASYNSSLRLPSFTEMYYKLKGYKADPHLKPEEMEAFEIGLQYNKLPIQAKLCTYYHKGRNMIDWIMDTSEGATSEWKSVNHTKLNSIGLEAITNIDFRQLFNSPLSSLNLSYSYIHQDKDLEQNIVSQYALEYLRHKFVATIKGNILKKLDLSMNLRWQDRVGSYTDFQNTVREYEPFTLINAKMTWKEKKYSLYAEVNNILNNRSYTDYGNVPQPGAWFIIGAKYHLDL